MLADEQVEVGVEGHAVALERRVAHLGHGAVERDLAANVRRHVGEVEDLLRRVPDRPLGEGESGRELLDPGALLDELVDRVATSRRYPALAVPFRDASVSRRPTTAPSAARDTLARCAVDAPTPSSSSPPGTRRRTCPRCSASSARELPGADVLVIDDGSTDATADVARAQARRGLVRREPRPARGHRRRLPRSGRAGLRVLRARRRRRPAPGGRAARACSSSSARTLRCRRRVALRGRARLCAATATRRAARALRHRPAAEGDARSARPAVPRPDVRDGRRERQGDARDGRAVRQRRAGGRGADAAARGGAARRRGRRRHARALERRVEAARQEGGQARAHRRRRPCSSSAGCAAGAREPPASRPRDGSSPCSATRRRHGTAPSDLRGTPGRARQSSRRRTTSSCSRAGRACRARARKPS